MFFLRWYFAENKRRAIFAKKKTMQIFAQEFVGPLQKFKASISDPSHPSHLQIKSSSESQRNTIQTKKNILID